MASDSDEPSDNLLFPALFVSPIPANFDPSVPPASAEEYLHHVAWEARQCQEIVTVDIDRKKIRQQGSLVNCPIKKKAPPGFAPSKETQDKLLADFETLRTQISEIRASNNIPKPPMALPEIKQREQWCKFCFGNSFQLALMSKKHVDISKLNLVEGNQPLLSIVLNIKQTSLEHLLEWHAQWLKAVGFSEAQGRWFYALLACLQTPLIPELCSLLRNVVRMCAEIRASLDSPNHPHLAQLNLIICIVAKAFSQEDLAD